MTNMRAKMEVYGVINYSQDSEALQMKAVCASSYPNDGADEDNTFAKFTPSATLNIMINNPALIGKFELGKKFYVDFSPAPE